MNYKPLDSIINKNIYLTTQTCKLSIHENIREKLHSFYVSNRIPHIIFYGSSGSGKQTIVYDFLKEIYHGCEQKIKANVMFVNCAHGKGIKFIREELKFFAKTNVQFNSGIWFKTIVLLNADHLTIDAQSALRRCIELFSHNTRFFIIVENKHKLLNPIISRFCEIYVPEYIDQSGNIINLHQWQIQQSYSFCKEIQYEQIDFIKESFDIFLSEGKQMNHKNMIELSSRFYENGNHSIDLIHWFKQSNRWNDFEKSNICMLYSKIKHEIRCEKLLMLFLLDFAFLRPKCDIKDISFM
jgi:replication-associated recombination protein RarA